MYEKYSKLASDALAAGDKVLAESYYQHADHFARILSIQELNKSQNDSNIVIEQDFKKNLDNTKFDQDKDSESKNKMD